MSDDDPELPPSDPELPPSDSPNWMPTEHAYRRLAERWGSLSLAAHELNVALRAGLPSLRRCFSPPYSRPQYQYGRVLDPARDIREPKLVAYHVDDPTWGIREAKIVGYHVVQWPACEWLCSTHWLEHRLSPRADGSLEVLTSGGITYASVKGFAYFVWLPALQRIWPDIFGPPPEPDEPGSRMHRLIRELADEEWSGGEWARIETRVIIDTVAPKLKARGVPVPHRSTFEHALGRRKK
jgi:hypothetical protein